MFYQALESLSPGQILFALSIIIGFIGIAWISRLLLVKYVKKLVQKTKTNLDDAILKIILKPLVAIVVTAGLYVASLTLPRVFDLWLFVTKSLGTLLILMGIYMAVMLILALLKWYRQMVRLNRKDVGFSLKLLSLCWVIIVALGFWLALIATLSVWGIEVGTVTGWLGGHGWRIVLIISLAMLVIVAVGEVIPKIVVRSLSRRPDEKDAEIKKRSDTLSKVLVSTAQVFVFLIAVFMILSELTIDILPILASASVVGVALGFGAQSLVKDVLAGLFIVFESQYRVGDVVKIADVSGVVESINLRRTILRDLDGIVHVVPNGEIRVASNFTKEVSRVNLNVSVSYKEDLDHVISVINKLGKELSEDPKWESIILKPPQVLRIDNFGESGIEVKITGDTQPMKQWDVTGELRLRLKKAFDEEKIEIPWPHTKVYFGNVPPQLNKCQTVEEK